jgi:hypothetical protein
MVNPGGGWLTREGWQTTENDGLPHKVKSWQTTENDGLPHKVKSWQTTENDGLPHAVFDSGPAGVRSCCVPRRV